MTDLRTRMNLVGKRFGRLTVVSEAPRKSKHLRRWACQCDCGGNAIAQQGNLLNGHSTSCGCFQAESRLIVSTRHGHNINRKRSRTLNAHRSMMSRCYNPKTESYQYYGQRGIRVCDRWAYFEQFLADMGECPHDLTLERKNNDGNYEPGNCRWATKVEQANNKRSNVRYEYQGRSVTLKQLSQLCDMNYKTLYSRLRDYGWSLEQAVAR